MLQARNPKKAFVEKRERERERGKRMNKARSMQHKMVQYMDQQ
jgi:hypothetical protein